MILTHNWRNSTTELTLVHMPTWRAEVSKLKSLISCQFQCDWCKLLDVEKCAILIGVWWTFIGRIGYGYRIPVKYAIIMLNYRRSTPFSGFLNSRLVVNTLFNKGLDNWPWKVRVTRSNKNKLLREIGLYISGQNLLFLFFYVFILDTLFVPNFCHLVITWSLFSFSLFDLYWTLNYVSTPVQ